MKTFRIIALVLAATTHLTALADETRSPLADWDLEARRAAEARAARAAATSEQAAAGRRARNAQARQAAVENRLTGSMIEVGAGIESAVRSAGIDVNSGWNILISVRGQIDADDVEQQGQRRHSFGRNRRGRFGDNRLMFLHVEGQLAIDPNNTSSVVPYLDIKVVPVSLTAVNNNALTPDNLFDESRAGDLTLFGIQFGQISAHRDIRLERDYRITVSAIGFDVRHREAISQNIDFVLAAAANIAGIRAQDSFTQMVATNPRTGEEQAVELNTIDIQVLNSDLLMSLLFHGSNRAWGARITLGGSVSGGGARSIRDDPRACGECFSRQYQYDMNAYAEAALNIGKFVELYTRISITHLRENGEYDPVQTRTITQFMTGASLQF